MWQYHSTFCNIARASLFPEINEFSRYSSLDLLHTSISSYLICKPKYLNTLSIEQGKASGRRKSSKYVEQTGWHHCIILYFLAIKVTISKTRKELSRAVWYFGKRNHPVTKKKCKAEMFIFVLTWALQISALIASLDFNLSSFAA